MGRRELTKVNWIAFLSVVAFNLVSSFSVCQLNHDLPMKEEFDHFFELRLSTYDVCSNNPTDWSSTSTVNELSGNYGDAVSKMLEGLLTMHETTGDLAYLYKFIHVSMCMLERRADVNNPTTHPLYDHDAAPPIWTRQHDPVDRMYQDGYIIAAFSRFAHYVHFEQSWLVNASLHPFDVVTGNNGFNQSFATFGDYALWLAAQSNLTATWYLINNYWNTSNGAEGMKKDPADDTPAGINMQVGFGRALLYLGKVLGNGNYLIYAHQIATNYKAFLSFNDNCDLSGYSDDVLRFNGADHSYWWYHAGYRVTKRTCILSPLFPTPNRPNFLENVEDISHGAVTAWLPFEFYLHQNSTPFTQSDMIRFRNMFTKNIFLGNDEFSNAVDGNNGPIYFKNPFSPFQEIYGGYINNNLFKPIALAYARLADFDGADGTAVQPNVYDILMDHYRLNITTWPAFPPNQLPSISRTPLPVGSYSGQTNKGHAELAMEQWERECNSLTLNRRDLVYDQDFWSHHILTINPSIDPCTTCSSFAEPTTTNKEFVVRSGAHTVMTAGNSVRYHGGFRVEAGGTLIATVNPEIACVPGEIFLQRPASNTDTSSNTHGTNNYIQKHIEIKSDSTALVQPTEPIVPNLATNTFAEVYPNPTHGLLNVNWGGFTEQKKAKASVYALTGMLLHQTTVFNGEVLELSLPSGTYLLELNIGTERLLKPIIID